MTSLDFGSRMALLAMEKRAVELKELLLCIHASDVSSHGSKIIFKSFDLDCQLA
jgi:hypothetical protein